MLYRAIRNLCLSASLLAGLIPLGIQTTNAQQIEWARQISGQDARTRALGFYEKHGEIMTLLFSADHPVASGRVTVKTDDSTQVNGFDITLSGEIRVSDSLPAEGLKLFPKTEGNQWLVKSKSRNGNYFLAYGLSSPTRLPVELNWSLAFMDGNGHRLWEKRLPDRHKVNSLTMLANGQCLIVGSETGPRKNPDISIAVWNEYGQELWHRVVGGMHEDEALCSAVDAEGHLYVGGYFSADTSFLGNTTDMSGNEKDGFIACYDQKGNQKFFYRQRGTGYNSVEMLAAAPNGRLFFAGQVEGKDWRLPPFGFSRKGVADLVIGLIDPRLKEEKQSPLDVFPNPAREVVYYSLNQKLPGRSKVLTATLHKKDGSPLQYTSIQNETGTSFRFNVSNTFPGAYYITVSGKGKSRFSERILVE